jgi:putative transposase
MNTGETNPPHYRRSIRYKGYDYTLPGAYFVTICTYKGKYLFGKIRDNEIQLNPCGRIAEGEWKRLERRFKYIDLDSFVIMPNHLHGIIIINDQPLASRGAEVGRKVSYDQACNMGLEDMDPARLQPGSLGAIVRAYKASVTRRIHLSRFASDVAVWQRNYYERILRDEDELNHARQYILDNVMKWEMERENIVIETWSGM